MSSPTIPLFDSTQEQELVGTGNKSGKLPLSSAFVCLSFTKKFAGKRFFNDGLFR